MSFENVVVEVCAFVFPVGIHIADPLTPSLNTLIASHNNHVMIHAIKRTKSSTRCQQVESRLPTCCVSEKQPPPQQTTSQAVQTSVLSQILTARSRSSWEQD